MDAAATINSSLERCSTCSRAAATQGQCLYTARIVDMVQAAALFVASQQRCVEYLPLLYCNRLLHRDLHLAHGG